MTRIDIVLIGIGLSMDAFAVSMAQGLASDTKRISRAFLVAIFFGGFQALMPLLGYALGSLVASYIHFGNWIAFAVLVFLGSKMIRDGFVEEADTEANRFANIPQLFLLAVATSIDALATGVSFSLQNTIVWLQGGISIFSACAMIGCITLVLSFLGFQIGHSFGLRFKKAATICGGVILVLIGVKILLESFGIWKSLSISALLYVVSNL